MTTAVADYSFTDFLMFSPASYFRLYELANTGLWPGQLLLLAIAVWLWSTMRRPRPRAVPVVALSLGVIWALVAGWFLYRQYAQINLAASWFALVFAVQALLLLGFSLFGGKRGRVFDHRPVRSWHPGPLLFAYALLLHPLVGLLAGRPWTGMELFGVAPDATALATLGVLLTGYRTVTWPLLVIPIAWCVVSALTYLAMGLVYGIVPLVLAVTGLAVTVVLHHSDRPLHG